MTYVLFFLIYCILAAITLGIFYWIIKKAVKNGILEAHREILDPPERVQYPIKIDEDHPDLPFNKTE